MKNRNLILLVFSVLFMVVVSFLAYNKLIPTEIHMVPFYDSVGHFILFGLLGLAAHYSFKRKRVPVFGRIVPIGPTLAIVFAFGDEALQVLSKNRTFDLSDLFFGVLGILVFITIVSILRNRKSFNLKFLATEIFFFVFKQIKAIIFPILFIFLLFISNHISIPGIFRYDFLFVGAVLIQIFLVVFKFETKDEVKVIFLFHIIGLCLELFKTHPSVGSWSYPEAGYLKILGVPLYSGFMYAAVGSYISQAWKIFKLEIKNHPSYLSSIILCSFIYLNFFTNHFTYDFRAFLFVAVFALYYKTNIFFYIREVQYRLPAVISFVLIGFFVWMAENIATFYGAWKYPGQIHEWHVVSLQKITSWALLVIICFIIVAWLKHFKAQKLSKSIKTG